MGVCAYEHTYSPLKPSPRLSRHFCSVPRGNGLSGFDCNSANYVCEKWELHNSFIPDE